MDMKDNRAGDHRQSAYVIPEYLCTFDFTRNILSTPASTLRTRNKLTPGSAPFFRARCDGMEYRSASTSTSLLDVGCCA